MAATYSELQTRVQRRIIDLPSAVQTEVPRLVNIALHKLQEKHNFKVMEGEVTVYTQINTHNILDAVSGSAVSIPGTYVVKEWRGDPWYIRYGDGSPGFMKWAPSQESIWGTFVEGGAISSDSGWPQVLVEGISDDSNNRAISVYPLADGLSDYPDGEYRIHIPYYRYLPDLSANGDHNWFTDNYSGEEFIVRYAAAEGHSLNWDFQKEAVLKAEAEIHYKDIVKADKIFRLSSVKEFVPHWRGANSNKTRV